jgi:hypothetical protein
MPTVAGDAEGREAEEMDRHDVEVLGRLGALCIPQSEMLLTSEEKRHLMACFALPPALILS